MSPAAPVHVHALTGCAPRPLGAWLKAVAVLRIVAEQADPAARGWWRGDTFFLACRLDEAALVRFFLHDYRPAPILSPWNKDAGFMKADDKVLDGLLASASPRFEGLRAAVRAGREAVAAAATPETRLQQKLSDKQRIQLHSHVRLRGEALRWVRAVMVVREDGDAKFPSLLGAGGADGRFEFGRNFVQGIDVLFDFAAPEGGPRPGAEAGLRASLFAAPARYEARGAIGQFSPHLAGGANMGTGPLADATPSPWELPLLLEGALLFTAGTSRRLQGSANLPGVAAAPFSVYGAGAGYGSASGADVQPRGELWLPLWDRPWTAGELAALLREGRAGLGREGVQDALGMARAVSRLGVARGVSAFERYGFMVRNGLSNFAIPLGRWRVQAEPRASLIDDLHARDWWPRLRRAAGDKGAPNQLGRLEGQVTTAIMGALQHGDDPRRWQALLLALAQIEAQLVDSGAYTAEKRLSPIPWLSPGWIAAADDGGPELPLALALAGAHDPDHPRDAVRGHWLPLDELGGFAKGSRALAKDPRVVCAGRDPVQDLLQLVLRRITEAEAGAARRLPLAPRPGLGARPSDLMALLRGEVDLARCMGLARALAALRWTELRPHHLPARPASELAEVDPAWAALRLCHLARPWGARAPRVPVDPAIGRALAADDLPRAAAVALRRLRAHGLPAALCSAFAPRGAARLLGASLAFPIDDPTAADLARLLSPQLDQEPDHVR